MISIKKYNIPLRQHQEGDFLKDVHDGCIIKIQNNDYNEEEKIIILKIIEEVRKLYPL